jgi:hypothetical protein
MPIKFVNLTSTTIRLFVHADCKTPMLELAPCDKPARVLPKTVILESVSSGCEIETMEYTIENLPDPVDGVYYIVEYPIVLLSNREDLVTADIETTEIAFREYGHNIPLICEVHKFNKQRVVSSSKLPNPVIVTAKQKPTMEHGVSVACEPNFKPDVTKMFELPLLIDRMVNVTNQVMNVLAVLNDLESEYTTNVRQAVHALHSDLTTFQSALAEQNRQNQSGENRND